MLVRTEAERAVLAGTAICSEGRCLSAAVIAGRCSPGCRAGRTFRDYLRMAARPKPML